MGVWLTGIVILLIVGILLDGWRRMRQGRRNNLKVRSYPSQLSPSDDYPSELPNGGARVVAQRRTEPKIGTDMDWDAGSDIDDAENGIDSAGSDRDSVDSDWSSTDSDVDNDLRAEKEEASTPISEAQSPHESYPEESLSSKAYESAPEPPLEMAGEDQPEAELPPKDEPVDEPRIPQQVTLNLDESVPMLMESVEQQEDPGLPRRPTAKPAPARELGPKAKAEPKAPATPPAASSTRHEPDSAEAAPEPEEVLIINVMAPSGTYFQGEALQKEIFDQGLRYGSMNIFHRYRDARGGGPVQFSLANMVKPGTFDLDAMDSFQTPGVSLFMTLPLEGDNVAAFDLMLATAKTLAETLGGELKDADRSAMTRQTMEHDRQRVLDFVRRQLSRVPG